MAKECWVVEGEFVLFWLDLCRGDKQMDRRNKANCKLDKVDFIRR